MCPAEHRIFWNGSFQVCTTFWKACLVHIWSNGHSGFLRPFLFLFLPPIGWGYFLGLAQLDGDIRLLTVSWLINPSFVERMLISTLPSPCPWSFSAAGSY